MARVEVYKDKADEWRWHRIVGGDVTDASSEGFKDKGYAVEKAREHLSSGDELVVGGEPVPWEDVTPEEA